MKKQRTYIGAGTFSVKGAHDIPLHPQIVKTEDSDDISAFQNYPLPKTFYQRYPNWNSLKLKLGLVEGE